MASEYNRDEYAQRLNEIKKYHIWNKTLSPHERARNRRILKRIMYDYKHHESYVPCVYLYDTLKNFYNSNKNQLSDLKKDKIKDILHTINDYIRIHKRKERIFGDHNQKIGDCVIKQNLFERFLKTLDSQVLGDIFIRERMDKLSDSVRPRQFKSVVHLWKKFLRFLRVGKHGKKSNFGRI